jgi:drug/metabolite transporter (DMT)-like permease
MGPLTFAAARYLLGAAIIAPLAVWEWRRHRRRGGPPIARRQWWLIGVITLAFFLGSILQQWGLGMTTVTNAGFLTGLYVFFTPAFAFVLSRARPHPIVYLCTPLALLGLFWLNGGALDRLGPGDVLVILCAAFWGLQILVLGEVAPATRLPIVVSEISFLFAGVAAGLLAPLFETPNLSALAAGWIEILYAGVLSTAVAFTFQAIAQQYVPAANAAIIQSSESLFAALGGFLILGERLPLVGYAGATLIFVAIVLVEAVPAITANRRPDTPVV